MAETEFMTVPMEFAIQDDGSLRLVIHITDVVALPQILRDIGNHVPEIIEALSQQMAEFINERKNNSG